MFYNPEEFLKVLEGKLPASALSKGASLMGPGCPALARATGGGCPFTAPKEEKPHAPGAPEVPLGFVVPLPWTRLPFHQAICASHLSQVWLFSVEWAGRNPANVYVHAVLAL